MFLNLKKTLFLVGSSALLFAGCGDDGDSSSTADAAPVVIDAAPAPDAEPDTTFGGTVSLAELSITNPIAGQINEAGISGAVSLISFTSPEEANPPEPGFESPLTGCKITIVDVAGGDTPSKGSDGGPVSITGTLAGDYACGYNADADKYLCSSSDAAVAGGAVAMAGSRITPGTGAAAGTATLIIADADFSVGVSRVGMSIVLKDFDQADANGVFSIVADSGMVPQLPDNALVVAATVAQESTPTADTTYGTLIGTGPIPGGYDFLDATTPVVVAKAEATDSPAIAASLIANGEGFTLADDSALPHAFPAVGPVTFSCDDANEQNGVCGDTGEGTLRGMIVFGETTDAEIPASPLAFSSMPAATGKYATFQCTVLNAKSLTMTAEAVALIMGTNPTRIQTTVTYTNAQTGVTNTVVGHGALGFTDVAAATSN